MSSGARDSGLVHRPHLVCDGQHLLHSVEESPAKSCKVNSVWLLFVLSLCTSFRFLPVQSVYFHTVQLCWQNPLVISQPQGTPANLICGALLWCLPGSWRWLGSWYSPKCCHIEHCFSQLPCVQQAHVSWEGVIDFKLFQLAHCNCAGCSDNPLQRKIKCSGDREGRGSSQLQISAISLCCDPREGKGLCQEHSWHLIWHPTLSAWSCVRASTAYQHAAHAKKNFTEEEKNLFFLGF